MLLCDDWLSELCPMSEKILIRGPSGNETSSHETALVTYFRALGNINTRRYAYNQQQQS